MYYLMNWDTYASEDMANTLTSPSVGIPWTMGLTCDIFISQPIVLPLNPERGRIMPDIFLVDIPLFSDKLLKTLKKAGVDNLQLYDAQIHSPEGKIFNNYKAVNIVGRVACADLEKSKYDPESEIPLMDFDKLVIDGSKIHEYLMFRLGEDCLQIIIHDSVKIELEKANLKGVIITPIEVVNI